MYGYIARRLVQLVFVLIGVSIITFLIMFLIPGNPAYLLAGKNADAGFGPEFLLSPFSQPWADAVIAAQRVAAGED